MTCQVELIADCGDVTGLARALFMSNSDDPNWLSLCTVSLSSCGSLLAVAYRNRLCLLTAQWISSMESNTYIIAWNGTLASEVTALLAVPVCSSGQSSQNGPDWLCIIVGFKNGAVGFYTNTGHQLFTEKLEEKPVVKISCHTGSFGTDPDDIHILYDNSECVLSGSSLFQTLRFAKAQLARVQAGVLNEFSLDNKNMNLRKWTFVEQNDVKDAAVVGLELKNTYDHLLAASMYGGYDTWYRSVPPHNTLVLGAGAGPYIGFHYALEGGASPPLQDVARAVASKIKSALPGWLGGGSSDSSANPAENKLRAEPLSMRSGLSDTQRHATSIVMSPDRRLAAVTDNLGRVAIVNIHKGNIIRMFKGYRDSQCAFVQVFESESRKGPQLVNIKEVKRAIFLVIYNPKKGLIDIRLMQRGSRVAVFTATKNGKLIYNTHGLLGAEQNYTQKKLNLPTYPCVLMDPDGKLKKLVIPFFYALEGVNSHRSKDLHLIREIKEIIKRNVGSEDDLEAEILKRASDIKTLDVKKHCLELLIKNNEIPPSIVMSCQELFSNSISQADTPSAEELKFKHYCTRLKQTTNFFMQINSDDLLSKSKLTKIEESDESLPNTEDVASEDAKSDEKNWSEYLHLSDNDNKVLNRLLGLAQENCYKAIPHLKVTFADYKRTCYKDFISSFDLEALGENVQLKSPLAQERLSSLGTDTFKPIFNTKDLCPKLVGSFAKNSQIDPKDLIKLLITYWINMELDVMNVEMIERCIEILFYICQCSDEATSIVYNEGSPWWQNIRDSLVEMPCPLRSMIIAMVCRIVVQTIEQKESSSEDDAWVSVTKENAKWSMLIGKLEDISLLSIVLLFKDTFKGKKLPKLKLPALEINLKFIYNRGKGSVSELIAKWLCCMGVIPEAIVANELLQLEDVSARQTDQELLHENDSKLLFLENNRLYVEVNPKIFKWFNLLKKQFPCSTLADNVITNMCWEYAATWQKGIQDIEKLEAVIVCLNTLTDTHVCLGLCALIWVTYIKPTFELSCRLVNKVGKLPKERLCSQDVGLTESQMVKFLDLTTQYLEKFLYCATASLQKEKHVFHFEKIWDESSPALVEVAQNTNNIDHDVLNVNYQISCSIYYQCYFNLKVTKPLNLLFDCDLQLIFNGINAYEDVEREFSLRSPERKLLGPRTRFLGKVTAAALELIASEEDSENEIKYQTTESTAWIDKVFTLAELWNVDKDYLRREQVVGLYRLGYDSLAEELVAGVREPEQLLQPLLGLCARRLKRCLEHVTDPANVLAALPPDLFIHLQTIESDSTISANISLKTTASVLGNVMCRIQNSKGSPHKQHLRLAEVMIYGCDILQEMNS